MRNYARHKDNQEIKAELCVYKRTALVTQRSSWMSLLVPFPTTPCADFRSDKVRVGG